MKKPYEASSDETFEYGGEGCNLRIAFADRSMNPFTM